MHISPEERIAGAEPPMREQRRTPVKVRRNESAAADAVRERGRPWYFEAPSIFAWCIQAALAPFNLAVRLAEGLVAFALLGAMALVCAWWQGLITDHDVIAYLRPVGQRLLAMVQQSGSAQ